MTRGFQLIVCDVCDIAKDERQIHPIPAHIAPMGMEKACKACLDRANDIFYEPLKQIFLDMKDGKYE